MKYVLPVYPFVYNKLLSGKRQVDMHLMDKKMQRIRVGDTIEYLNPETRGRLQREVKGVAFFGDFETLIDMLPSQMFGYDDKEEIRLRVERLYPQKLQHEFGVCALFIGEPDNLKQLKMNYLER